MQFFGYGAPPSENKGSAKDLLLEKGKSKDKDDVSIAVESQRAQAPAPILRKAPAPGTEAEDDDPKDRLRKIERRAAAAQQRSLDKKIQALNEEMAEVEALLNRSMASRQVEPAVANIAEKRKQDLKESISAIASECVVSSVEVSIDLNSASAASNGDASPGPTWAPVGKAGEDSPTTTSSSRKVRSSGRRATEADDGEDKYKSKTGPRPGFQQ